MTRARSQQVCLDATPYYHCVSRCVRRTYLCGYDKQSQVSYEHRRGWIETRIKQLSQIFCIDICAYAVMSNHYHIVVHVDRDKANMLTDNQIIERWQTLHSKPVLIERYLSNQINSEIELIAIKEIIATWRERLFNLSWFMRELNFYIAMKANREESCSGHFWESRYKSQALLDEKALLAAMAYTDLNPIRAGIAEMPETSEYTSIKERLKGVNYQQSQAPCLHPFIGHSNNKLVSGIPFKLIDYIELVDWTGRRFRERKAQINSQLPLILDRLNINQREWLTVCLQLEKHKALLVGQKENMQLAIPKMGRQRIRGYLLT